MAVTETGPATGIFEGHVTFSSKDQSSGHRLRVSDGDTVTAKYEDNTLPKPYTKTDDLKISAGTFVGPVIPPLERVPVSSHKVIDSFGNNITQIKINQQIQITANIANKNITDQPFTYLVQIQDSSEAVQSLSWITGKLVTGQTF